MYASDVLVLVRQNINDTNRNAGQRFSDSSLINWLNQAQRRLMRDVLFPTGRMLISTVANQQEYQCGVVLRTDSVYVNGQLCVPTDSIATLEGHQIQLYDQGQGGANPAPVPGSGLPQSTLGPYAPTWGTLTPAAYPVQFVGGGGYGGSWPAPDAGPAMPGGYQQPRFYYRSGYIGLVPAPSMTPPLDANGNPIPNLVIDGVFLPPVVGSTADPLIFPDHFCEALAWKVCEFTKFSDDTGKSSESRTFAKAEYREAMIELRLWAATYTGDAANGPKVQTARAFYQRGGYRSPSRGGGYPS